VPLPCAARRRFLAHSRAFMGKTCIHKQCSAAVLNKGAGAAAHGTRSKHLANRQWRIGRPLSNALILLAEKAGVNYLLCQSAFGAKAAIGNRALAGTCLHESVLVSASGDTVWPLELGSRLDARIPRTAHPALLGTASILGDSR
jgi:hypothetical protein